MFKDLQEISFLVRFDFVWVLLAEYYLIKEIFEKKLIKNNSISLGANILLYVLLAWTFFNIFIQPPMNINGFVRYLGGRYYVSAFVPLLFIYIGGKVEYWKQIWSYALKFSRFITLSSPLLLLLYFTESFWWVRAVDLLFFSPLLILNFENLKRKEKRYLIAGYALAILFSFLGGSRGFTLHFLSFIVAQVFYFMFFVKRGKGIKIVASGFFVILLIITAYFVYTFNVSEIVPSQFSQLVYKFQRGGFENSREGIVYPEFFADMRTMEDWIYGRGLNGAYYSPGFVQYMKDSGLDPSNSLGVRPGYRPGLECGYLQTILKIGLIGLILILILTFLGIYLGLFRSKNNFVKVGSFILIEWLVFMYPAGLPEFSLSFILFCLCLGLTLSKETRAILTIEAFIGRE